MMGIVTSDAPQPAASDEAWRDTVVQAGVDASDAPEPTAAEVEGYIAFHERIVTYLESAAYAWVAEHWDPKRIHQWLHIRLDPTWTADPDQIEFLYYATGSDEYNRLDSVLTIPAADLLPQFGGPRAVLKALRS